VKNSLAIGGKGAEQIVKVAHRLCVLAGVPNAPPTARPAVATVDAFRKSYTRASRS